MKHVWKLLLAALLACALLLPASAMADAQYGKANRNDVSMMNTPLSTGTVVFTIDKGDEFEIKEAVLVDGKLEWYKVWCMHPTEKITYEVYVKASYVDPVTAGGNEGSGMKPSTDSALGGGDKVEFTGTTVTGVKGTVATDTAFYDQPSASGKSIGVIPADTTVDVTGIPAGTAILGWYRVEYNDKVGYVHGSQIEVDISGEDEEDEDDTPAIQVKTATGETNAAGVALYAKMDATGTAQMTLGKGTKVELLSNPAKSGQTYWYKVSYLGREGYIQYKDITVVDTGYGDKFVAWGVTVNTNGVNFRKGAGVNYDSMAKLTSGIVVELLAIPEKTDANHWYKVRYNGDVGYIQAPYIQKLEVKEEENKPVVPDDDDEELETSVEGVIINTNGVNFRKSASVNAESMGKLTTGTKVEVLSIPDKIDAKHWFKVRYNNQVGYIQAPYVSVPSMEEKPDEEPTPTPEPYLFKGQVVGTNGLNFRSGPGTKYNSMEQLPAGTVVELLAIPEKVDANHWYKARYNGKVGYLQAPYIKVLGVDEEEDEPTNAPTTPDEDEEKVIGYGVTVKTNGVNFRKGPGTQYESMDKLVSGVFVELLSIPDTIDAKSWYKVLYNEKVGYIQAPYIQVLSADEPSEEPTDKPDEEITVLAKGVIVNTNGVNFRKSASVNSDSMAKLKSGVEVDLLSIPEMTTSSYWYKVSYDGKIGYIQAPYIRVIKDGEDTDTPTATPEWDEDVVGIGMITSTTGVNFRKTPSVNGTSMGKLTAGVTVDLLRIPDGSTSEYWYKIRYKGQDGYVQAPYVIVLEGDVPDGGDILSDVVGIGTVTSTDGVNFRTGPGTSYGSMGRLAADTNVELLYIPDQIDENNWYKVRFNNKTGYIQAPFIRVVTVVENALPDASIYGYAKLIEDSANLRETAYGETVTTWKGKGSLLRITGEMVSSGYYEWIPVYYPADSAIYYVRADMVQMVKVHNGQIVTPTPAPASRYGYVITTGQGVNLRIQPGEESIAQIPRNTILVCVGDAVEPWGSDYTWYEVKYNGMIGFVRGDYVRVCDQNGDPLDDEEDGSDEEEEIQIYGYIKLNTGNKVNLREKPLGSSLGLLPNGMILPVIDETIPKGMYGQYTWYKVRTADGQTGYIRGDCVAECDINGVETEPTATPAPTEKILGYVQITGNAVYLREEPFGTAIDQMNTKTVWPIVGANKVENKITWYNIKVNGKVGFVHGDYAVQLTKEQEEVYKDTGAVPEITPPAETVMSNHVITYNTNKLNIRESYSQDSASLYQVGSGVVMEFIGTKKVGTVTWYNVIYKDIELWAHGDYLKVMTDAEYKAWLALNPDYLPGITDNIGYVRTVQDNVYVRNAANGSERIDKIAEEGTVMRYYAEGIAAGEYDWYRVLTPDGDFGYVRGDLVEKCDMTGKPLPTEKPNLGNTSSAPKTQQETSYTTLDLGDSGAAVTNLVNELKNQGYFTGKVTSNFTSAVKNAVEAFQAAKGLYVDGIAGSATQHALYGTVPIGAGDTSNLSFPIYPVEKIDWFTGGIQQMIPRGANFKVYDVKTGIVWWAHRWAGGFHADIETLTKADSNRLCQIYGVDSLEEIVEENMWQRRPSLVTIGTRTFACSLDGMQHNPDGDTIANNGMNGQICLHFTNSTGHSEGAGVSSSHKEAIQYAYDNCPAGKK